MNTMKLAHMLRKTLNIQGCYRVQMKAALALAWMVKKGQITMEAAITGNVAIFDKSIKIEEPVAPKVIEQVEEIETVKDIASLDEILAQNKNRFTVIAKDNGYEFYKNETPKLIAGKFNTSKAHSNALFSAYIGDSAGLPKANRAKQPVPANTLFIINKEDEERYQEATPRVNSGYEFIVCDCL